MQSTIHPVIRQILIQRGIAEPEDMNEFLSSKPQKTYDPFLMKGMEQAVKLILTAAQAGQKICIYGDYDSDGVNATSLLMQVLSHLTTNLEFYLPSRFDEGYGLNREALSFLRDSGVDLVVTVDCGSTSYAEVEHAKSIGLSIIVTDHHNINHRIADCILLNPKQEGCAYPFKELCGCGVAFKLAQALQRQSGLPRQILTDVLDLVAIATVGDIVPLLDENRTLVKHGLAVIRKNRRPGLSLLIQAIGLDPVKIKAWNLAFGIVPHLNAAGRILNANTGVILLTTGKAEELAGAVEQLIAHNQERRRIQEATLERCQALLGDPDAAHRLILLDAEDAHEGITGIVAGKLKDERSCPVIIVTQSTEEGFVKGTGRSITGINLYEMLKKYESLFAKFGGHSGACGFLLAREHVDPLRKSLTKDAEALYLADPALFTQRIKADAELQPGEIDGHFLEQLEALEPFGWKNEAPQFLLRQVTILKKQTMGDKQQHLKMTVQGVDGTRLDCILFQKAQQYGGNLAPGSLVDLIGSPQWNAWNGNQKIQFVVKDVS